MKMIDFRTLYGRLGSHPGSMGPQEGMLIYNGAMESAPGGFLEINPGTGRTTVVLGTAAKNVGAKLFILAPPADAPTARWFDAAVRMHGFAEAVVLLPDLFAGTLERLGVKDSLFDLVLLNGELSHGDSLPIRPGGTLILRGGIAELPGAECVVDHRPAISVWKRHLVAKEMAIDPPAVRPKRSINRRKRSLKPQPSVMETGPGPFPKDGF